jgi:hypothetical protein
MSRIPKGRGEVLSGSVQAREYVRLSSSSESSSDATMKSGKITSPPAHDVISETSKVGCRGEKEGCSGMFLRFRVIIAVSKSAEVRKRSSGVMMSMPFTPASNGPSSRTPTVRVIEGLVSKSSIAAPAAFTVIAPVTGSMAKGCVSSDAVDTRNQERVCSVSSSSAVRVYLCERSRGRGRGREGDWGVAGGVNDKADAARASFALAHVRGNDHGADLRVLRDVVDNLVLHDGRVVRTLDLDDVLHNVGLHSLAGDVRPARIVRGDDGHGKVAPAQVVEGLVADEGRARLQDKGVQGALVRVHREKLEVHLAAFAGVRD